MAGTESGRGKGVDNELRKARKYLAGCGLGFGTTLTVVWTFTLRELGTLEHSEQRRPSQCRWEKYEGRFHNI